MLNSHGLNRMILWLKKTPTFLLHFCGQVVDPRLRTYPLKVFFFDKLVNFVTCTGCTVAPLG